MTAHGRSRYSHYGCRCDVCREAKTLYMWQRTQPRLAAAHEAAARGERYVSPTGVHGKVSTYRNHCCRCEACTAANTTATREKNRRRRERAS